MQGFPTELRPLLALVIVLAIAHIVLKSIARKASRRSPRHTRRTIAAVQRRMHDGEPKTRPSDPDAWQAGASEMPIDPDARAEHNSTQPLSRCTPEEALLRLRTAASIGDND